MKRGSTLPALTFALFSVAIPWSIAGAQQPCLVPDNGGGTVDLPPAGCGYVSPSDLHLIIDGLPTGTQINIDPVHDKFFNVSRVPGGNLGGEIEEFDSLLTLQMTGMGPGLDGFVRTISMPVHCEVHTGPRTPGDPIQTFPNEMVRLEGQIFGDPDFDTLQIQGGSDFGLPSPGITRLDLLPGGTWNVDSFFDVEYRIDFAGALGSVLEGFGGTTQDTVNMRTGEPAPPQPPCIVPDNGTGTIDLPPAGCGYLSPDDVHLIIDGLPPGTTINLSPIHSQFFNVTTTPGGNFGPDGEIEKFDSFLDVQLSGTGDLAGFRRSLSIPLATEVHSAPRTPGQPVQDFDTEMVQLQGAIFGDPDFDQLLITGGSGFDLPSPGHTTLTQLPDGNFNVDSFFDVEYRIDFAGALGGALDGLSGSTQDNVPMQSGVPSGGCPPIPAGTDMFPATGKIVVDLLDDTGEPFIVRLSSARDPDTIVGRETQVGDTIDVEIVQLELSGFHPMLGEVRVHQSSTQPSTGQLRNVVQDPSTCELFSADSFFDIIVDIDVPALGQVWVPQQPLHFERRIGGLPPEDEPFEIPFLDPVTLVDQTTGQARAEILYQLYHANPPFPPPGQDCFDTFLQGTLNIPTLGFQGPVALFGPTTVARGPQQGGHCTTDPAVACESDADCVDTGGSCLPRSIPQQLEELNLVGFDPLLGAIQTKLRPDAGPSAGQSVSQQPDRTYAADSFFDVSFDIVLVDQDLVLHNAQPVPVAAIGSSGKDGIANIPPDPGSTFQSPPGLPFPLEAEDGTPVGSISNVVDSIQPPRDWAPPPPAEDYCFDSSVHLRLTIFNPFCEEDLSLDGIFRILRDDPTLLPTGQDVVAALMAKAVFEGNSECVGPLTVGLDPAQASSGEIASLAPDEFYPADSFFDVFTVMDTGIGLLHTRDPAHMTTTINALPPTHDTYFEPGAVIGLFDETGLQIGEIAGVSNEVHELFNCPRDCGSIPYFLNKDELQVGIPGGGGGVGYDVWSGDLSSVASYDGFLLQVGGPPVVSAGTVIPGILNGRYYLSRARFGGWTDTWSSLGAGEVCCRDDELP